ncbi:uncharacterized protein LOC129599206 isoform X2 [Paramacrobiotus metropolitanus]|uniref:uncharacterized protein LOC129599206 isoform X2 n=1 Tax=Paramacrobiotus metropolitanus TaxID=2943436 RepID=UPI0024456698|nr:uncharacterized protein LOC129599206 isoform X2 [Paramacrobiotus metropolitanus]XP_055353348.1 uncharacterized protein LOC129599206 isoform X2 [Paramacrobiotus metropolitanus]XP_055353349.1 uncharacterized protein LOC129599206 isoform X2 [Paramacrobiotus metropolitanus]
MPTQQSSRAEVANGLLDHGMLFAAHRSRTITHRMESVTHALVHSSYTSASAQLADDIDDDFDEPTKLRIDDGSDGSSDTWSSSLAVIGELRNPVDRSSALKRSASRNCYPDLTLHSKRVSLSHVAQDSKRSDFPQIVSDKELFLSFYDKRETPGTKINNVDTAQARSVDNGCPSCPAGDNTDSNADPVKKDDTVSNSSLAASCSRCHRPECDCESKLSPSADNPIVDPEPPKEDYDIPPGLGNQDLPALMQHLTEEERKLFTDLFDSVMDFSLQDLLREEMDEGHRPLEPTPEGLDLMTNSWEDVFQNPYDYMLHTTDSCPNCGRQITLSRMAPHIVSRCGESRSVEERTKRLGKNKNGLVSMRSTRSTTKDASDAALYGAMQPSSSSSTPLDDRDDSSDVEILDDIPAPLPIPPVSSVYKPIGFPVGSRIASISEKLLRSKRQTSLSPEFIAQKKVKLKKGENVVDDGDDSFDDED